MDTRNLDEKHRHPGQFIRKQHFKMFVLMQEAENVYKLIRYFMRYPFSFTILKGDVSLMKADYKIIINHDEGSKKPLIYTYGNTRNIELHMHRDSAMIAFKQNAMHHPEVLRSCTDLFCSDAIKKAMMVHLMRYGKILPIRTLRLSLNGVIKDVYIAKQEPTPLVYSMINRHLDYPLPDNWQSEAVISTVLNSAKSAYDGRHNALVALLIAKSKEYRSEKAMYLWMAMNGLYGYLASIANEYAENRKSRISEEGMQQNLMCILSGIPMASVAMPNENKTKLMRDAVSILKKSEIPHERLYSETLEGIENNTIKQLGETITSYGINIPAYPFLCIWLPYQIRCNYFHAGTALPLFSYADELLLKVLQYTNYFVENFVEKHLPVWLESKVLNDDKHEQIHQAYLALKPKS